MTNVAIQKGLISSFSRVCFPCHISRIGSLCPRRLLGLWVPLSQSRCGHSSISSCWDCPNPMLGTCPVIIHTSSSFIVTREENAAHLLHPLRLEPHSIHPRKSWSRSISWTHSSLPKTRGALSGLGTFLCCQQSERKEAASPSIPSLTWCMAVFRNNLAQSISHRLWRELLH